MQDHVLLQTRSILAELIERVNQVTQARRIIVFGSTARGEATPQSDIDILVVVTGPIHHRKLAQEIYRNLHGIQVPVDVIVATEDEVQQYANRKGFILSPALKEGLLIYECKT
jgi:uncharacterized protein